MTPMEKTIASLVLSSVIVTIAIIAGNVYGEKKAARDYLKDNPDLEQTDPAKYRYLKTVSE